MRRVLENWLLIAAGISIAVTLGLAISDRTSSAALTAGLSLALVVVHNFPLLESVKGWGVEAKMREMKRDLEKAAEILQRIETVSTVFVNSTLNQMLHAGSIVPPAWEERAEIIKDMRKLYVGEVFPERAAAIESKLLAMLGFRHLKMMHTMLIARSDQIGHKIHADLRRLEESSVGDATQLKVKLGELINSFDLTEKESVADYKFSEDLISSFEKYLRLEPSHIDTYWTMPSELYKGVFGSDPPKGLF